MKAKIGAAKMVLLLDGAIYLPQMLAKCMGWIGRTFGQILVKPKLLAELPPSLYCFCLAPFCLPDGVRCREELLDSVIRSEQNSVSVSEHNIPFLNLEVTETRRSKGIWVTGIQPLGSDWTRAVTKDRKTNLFELFSVSMATPNNHARQSTGPSLENCQVSNATLVHPPPIVNHQHIPWLRHPHCFQENIYTPIMSYGQSATSNMAPRR
jgi:hypothetical protein